MHRLIKLLASNSAGRRPRLMVGGKPVQWYDPDADGDDDADAGLIDTDAASDSASIYFYDAIGGWDQPTTESLVRAIAGLKAGTINLRINSPGGIVTDAVALQNAIAQHPARVVAYIDGLAASAASTLMLAGDEIVMAPGAFIMIHDPWTVAIGSAADMRKEADILDKFRDSIAAQYATKTGMKMPEITKMMAAETWLSAEDAVAQGFADRVATKPPAAQNLKRFDLSAFDHAPAALIAPPRPTFDAGQWAANMRAINERRLRTLA